MGKVSSGKIKGVARVFDVESKGPGSCVGMNAPCESYWRRIVIALEFCMKGLEMFKRPLGFQFGVSDALHAVIIAFGKSSGFFGC